MGLLLRMAGVLCQKLKLPEFFRQYGHPPHSLPIEDYDRIGPHVHTYIADTPFCILSDDYRTLNLVPIHRRIPQEYSLLIIR